MRVLATTDLHAHLLSWNYDTDQIAPARGLSRLATLIHRARREAKNCVLFDNGDFLTGSGLSEAMLRQSLDGAAHPMITAMNYLRYDAVGIGNHEFSNGLDFFRNCAAQAKFPLICSNFTFDGISEIAPHAVLHRDLVDLAGGLHRIKIGVLALLPGQTMVWESRHLGGIAHPTPMMQAAQNACTRLRDEGADVVIALAHTGFDEMTQGLHEESMAKSLQDIAGIDAIISGHNHKVFPAQPQGEIALVSAGFFGSHLGVIDLTLVRAADSWRCARWHSETRPISQRGALDNALMPLVKEDPQIVAIAQQTHTSVTAAAQGIIGHSDIRLHSYFALLTDSPALTLIAAVQMDHIRTVLTDPTYKGIPIIAAAAPFKAGGRGGPENYTDLLAGPLRLRNVCDLYTYPNHLVAFAISGAELLQWLERSVSLYHQIPAGARDAVLIDPDFPSFNFDVVFGLRYQINLAQPSRYNALGQVINPGANRIENLTYQGRRVTADQPFILVSNSFRRDGDAGFAGTDSGRVIYESGAQMRDLVQDFITGGAQVAAPDPMRWHFAPMQGTTVLFDSSPRAADVLGDVAHLHPQPMQCLESGFQRFRLHL